MKNEARNLIKELKAGRDLKENVKKYAFLTSTAFTKYAVIRLSMNYFTMLEMLDECEDDRKKETEDIANTVKAAIENAVFEGESFEEDIEKVLARRQEVTEKMKVLTSYTDAMSLFEYVLLRKNPEISVHDVNKEAVAENMFNYVFQDNDKLVVNSKIQSFIAELPVRMTKERFFDIIRNTLMIYKGGEKEAVNDFAEMVRTASLIEKPEGFEKSFPALYDMYKTLSEADLKKLEKSEHLKYSAILEKATEIISSNVTDYLMLEQIINDTLVILLTSKNKIADKMDDSYASAISILKECVAADSIYSLTDKTEDFFISLEGAQEDAYETLANVSSSLFDIYTEYSEVIEEAGMTDVYSGLIKADKLTSTSLFIDLDKEIRVVNDAADDEYIEKVYKDLEEGFRGLFEKLGVSLRRGVMAKVLSVIPVFFNNKEEIKEYFLYALDRCSDETELLASVEIINEMMLGD